MSFKLTNEQMKMLIDKQTAPPTTGDLFLWAHVDRKEKKAKKIRQLILELELLRQRLLVDGEKLKD